MSEKRGDYIEVEGCIPLGCGSFICARRPLLYAWIQKMRDEERRAREQERGEG